MDTIGGGGGGGEREWRISAHAYEINLLFKKKN